MSELHHRTSAGASPSHIQSALIETPRGPTLARRNKTVWQRTKDFFPILEWLPRYHLGRDLKFDIAAGITVAMMLIPQEVSLAGIMHVPPENGLYTAATTPFVYALFGSSTVLSVASGSEVSLLVGAVLEPIKNDDERVATGILLAFLIGTILLIVRALNLSQVADFFSRPVMGGFISAGGFLVGLSQVPNWLSIKIPQSSYPPENVYNIFKGIKKTEKHSFLVGLFSIIFLILLKVIKKRCFPGIPHSQLFNDDNQQQPAAKKVDGSDEILTPVTDVHTHQGHGFSLTDQQYLSMAAEQRAREAADQDHVKEGPKGKTGQWLYFLARTMCDLGPLMVCIGGGIAGYMIGAKKIKVTGKVPGGFPAPRVPWYGFSDGLIDGSKFPDLLLHAATISIVVYLSSIAMAKRLAIQRGETIRTNQELTGLGFAGVVAGFFRAMPPTGGMSRTAVNLQNARTQLASIVTVLIIILSLYTLTGTLYYIPKSTLSAIIIVAGYSLVEITEAKWLFRVRRDEFYVWSASFIGTLALGVKDGLFFSIAASLLALMWKTKRVPVSFLAELDNGQYVDRASFPEAKPLDDVIAVRIESSLYFANCERVVDCIDEEIERVESEGVRLRGVVLDAFHMNDVDATTIQVISDLQEKLAFRKAQLAIANATGRVHDVLASTNLFKRIVAQNPRLRLEEAIRILRNLPIVSTSTSPASASGHHAV